MPVPSKLVKFKFGEREIEIHAPDADYIRLAFREGKIKDPYWSRVWPAAIGLTTFILEHFHWVKGKKVLELAAGLGLPSIASAFYADQIICSELEPDALELVMLSAKHNGITNLHTLALNWNNLPDDLNAEVLLLSDINYDPSAFPILYNMINRFLKQGTTILLSTPQRLVAKDFILELLPSCIKKEDKSIIFEGKEVMVSILVLKHEAAMIIQ